MRIMKTVEVAVISKNIQVSAGINLMTVVSPKITAEIKPGQFILVKVSRALDPLLPRPLGIHRIEKDKISLLYEVVGKGTEMLADKKSGEIIDIIGPLGKGFSMKKGRRNILVAGGIGMAPLGFLSQKINVEKAFVGSKTGECFVPGQALGAPGDSLCYCTEDGSCGREGFVTEALSEFVEGVEHKQDLYIYACGPKAMVEALLGLAKKYGLKGEASMDERMACGVGACLGCVIDTIDGKKTCCQDGPVFTFEELTVK